MVKYSVCPCISPVLGNNGCELLIASLNINWINTWYTYILYCGWRCLCHYYSFWSPPGVCLESTFIICATPWTYLCTQYELPLLCGWHSVVCPDSTFFSGHRVYEWCQFDDVESIHESSSWLQTMTTMIIDLATEKFGTVEKYREVQRRSRSSDKNCSFWRTSSGG